MSGIEMTGYDVLVDFQMIQSAIARGRIDHGAEGIHQFSARTVIERESQHHARIVLRGLARPLHLFLHRWRQCVLASKVFQANVVLIQRGYFRFQITAKQAHEESDITGWTFLPVLFGESVERERGNANARSSLHGRAHGRNSGAMSSNARKMAALSP